ncbi:MAG: hypothetical protein DME05_25910 [Candidatus Rokuibacteriota bacterium]|nr:MAG: hypothetical protein DME05_25910 [Candidatus Rokubacteria bacterium]
MERDDREQLLPLVGREATLEHVVAEDRAEMACDRVLRERRGFVVDVAPDEVGGAGAEDQGGNGQHRGEGQREARNGARITRAGEAGWLGSIGV